MTGCCSWGHTSEIKQCSHIGTLGHLENKVLVSKKEKGIAKRIFFGTRQ